MILTLYDHNFTENCCNRWSVCLNNTETTVDRSSCYDPGQSFQSLSLNHQWYKHITHTHHILHVYCPLAPEHAIQQHEHTWKHLVTLPGCSVLVTERSE